MNFWSPEVHRKRPKTVENSRKCIKTGEKLVLSNQMAVKLKNNVVYVLKPNSSCILAGVYLALAIRIITLNVFLLNFIGACQTGMQITLAEELRPKMPMALMDCQMLKVSINKLDCLKMVNVLKTIKAHDDIIVNCDDEKFGRMNMETAVRI